MAMCEDSGALFAVKTVPMGGPTSSVEATFRSVQRELEVLRGVSHPHIVDMFAVSCAAATSTPAALCGEGVANTGGGERHDRNTARAHQGIQGGGGLVLNIAMEYMEGGSLAKLIDDFGQLPEQVVASYARQIVLGLEYLHALGVVHADIKPANCLLDKSGLLKLSDFGCAQRIVAHSSTHEHEASQQASSQQASSRKRGEGELGLQVVSSRAELDKLDDDELSDGGAAVLGALEHRLICHRHGANVNTTRATLGSLMPEGTPNYMPSEVIRYREYSDKSDVWALGLTVLECLTGERG
jgi:serine/threonine protein kinase